MYYFPHINVLRTISSERKNRSKSPVPSPPLPSNFPLSFSFGEDGFTQTTHNSSPLGTGRGLPPPKTPIFDFIFSGRMLPINAAPGDGGVAHRDLRVKCVRTSRSFKAFPWFKLMYVIYVGYRG